MDRQAKILKYAQEQGWDVSRLSRAQIARAALEVSIAEGKLVGDVAALAKATVRSAVGLTVLPSKIEENLKQCQTNQCGRYYRTPDGRHACLACGCSGKALDRKVADPTQMCPIENPETKKPYWSNVEIVNASEGKGS